MLGRSWETVNCSNDHCGGTARRHISHLQRRMLAFWFLASQSISTLTGRMPDQNQGGMFSPNH